MKKIHLLILAILLSSLCLQTSCSKDNYDALSDKELFELEMTAALADAQVYGPQTQALAKEVADKYKGGFTELRNYGRLRAEG